MNSKLDDQTSDFLMEAPYTDSVKGVISSVMIRVSGIKNKYGCPAISPPEMNKELDEVYFKAEKAIRQAVGEEILEFVGSDETLMEQSEYDKIDVPHKETDRSVHGEMLYTVRQATRNGFRAELRQKIKQWQG